MTVPSRHRTAFEIKVGGLIHYIVMFLEGCEDDHGVPSRYLTRYEYLRGFLNGLAYGLRVADKHRHNLPQHAKLRRLLKQMTGYLTPKEFQDFL